jgi:hypothetical protein
MGLGSGILDPGSEIRDPEVKKGTGSWIRNSDLLCTTCGTCSSNDKEL